MKNKIVQLEQEMHLSATQAALERIDHLQNARDMLDLSISELCRVADCLTNITAEVGEDAEIIQKQTIY
ncbi:MAG: hypothetical protein LBN11_06435 [Tannerella sp.]|nr:hypothetical protein [Tannerella sp.]